MKLNGILTGIICFLCIGAFHPIVIKAEYYLSSRCWPIFLAVGVLLLIVSTNIDQTLISAAFGVVGCSCLWSIIELKQQKKRVERGWFPKRKGRTGF